MLSDSSGVRKRVCVCVCRERGRVREREREREVTPEGKRLIEK